MTSACRKSLLVANGTGSSGTGGASVRPVYTEMGEEQVEDSPWDDDNPLHAEMPTPSNTLSMVTDATYEAERGGYRADEAVRLVYCQSYLLDDENVFDEAHVAFGEFMSGVDFAKCPGEVVAFYIVQHKNLVRDEGEPLQYFCLHTLLLSGLLWDSDEARPLSFVMHQHRTVSAPHQTTSESVYKNEIPSVELEMCGLNLTD